MRKQIKYLIMDVDGTLTDGKIYMGVDGEFCKGFSIKDGCGINLILIPAGILPIIITGRKSKILENRCKEIGIDMLYQGVSDKVSILNEILTELNGIYSECAYIGDDINDLSAMQCIRQNNGIIGCPADSAKEVIEIADFVSNKKGGDGAVREFIEYLVQP